MADDATTAAPEGRPPPGGRRRWWIVGGALLVLVVALGAFYAVLRSRSAAPPSVDEALARQGGSTSGTTAPAGGPVRPQPGVYTATGSGREELSLNPTPQPWGPTIPVAVTAEADGCSTVRIDYNSNHWQTWRYCQEPDGSVVERGGQTSQRTDLVFVKVDSVSTFVCDPPSPVLRTGARPGDVIDQRCAGTSSAMAGETVSAGPARFVGEEDVVIGTTTVRARRMHQDRTLSGAQTGEERTDTWFTEAGVPVRSERNVRVSSPSPIGDVVYTEAGTWQLDSMTPRTG